MTTERVLNLFAVACYVAFLGMLAGAIGGAW